MQGPKIWNILPKAITIIDGSINLFKNALSSFLVHFPDQPPVNGHTTVNINSLLQCYLTLNKSGTFVKSFNT